MSYDRSRAHVIIVGEVIYTSHIQKIDQLVKIKTKIYQTIECLIILFIKL